MTDYTDMSWEELPDGFYYIKLDDGKIRTDCYEGGYGFIRTSENDIEKILSPVPSYKEYLESEAQLAEYKELLRECQPYIKSEKENWIQQGYWDAGEQILKISNLLTKIEKVLR